MGQSSRQSLLAPRPGPGAREKATHDPSRRVAAGGCVSQPRYRGVMVDAGYTDKTIRIADAQPAMMKLNDALLAQRAQTAVHMDESQSRRNTALLSGGRQIHLLHADAWPFCPYRK